MLKITEYPTTAWVLQPSFKPVKVELVKRKFSLSSPEYHATVTGKPYNENDLFASKQDAIAAGRAEIEKMEADLAKRRTNLDKRIAALDKAEA